MPELPEVETIRRGLEEYLVGKKITGVEVKLARIVSGNVADVIGTKVKEVRRAGKGLMIELLNGYTIAAHIKLTGQFIYRGKETKAAKLSLKVGLAVPNNWTHVIFKFEAGHILYYNDLRQFVWIKIVKTDEIKTLPFFKELGPEPPVIAGRTSGDDVLAFEKFSQIVSKSSTKIKPLLMDQKKIGGIGNIYANDALWMAKIDPQKSAKTLTESEQKLLYESILEVLKRGLKYGGASELNYVNAKGGEGGYQKHFLAYAQDGQPCTRCHTRMRKIFLGGRGTYFCEKCQK